LRQNFAKKDFYLSGRIKNTVIIIVIKQFYA